MESESSSLDVNQAAAVLAEALEPKEPEQEQEVAEEEGEQSDTPVEEAEADEEGAQKITIEVDGKVVELTPQEVADAYKNGLRQSDYTKKTMEAAETRKAAEAELVKAQQERQEYAERLGQFSNILQAQLQEQSQTNWAELLDNDPVEYLKQQHLYQQRQAQLYQAQQEQSQLFHLHQQEQQKAYAQYIQAEQSSLLDKIPAWRDEGKAKAEKAEIRDFLKAQGFTDQDISNVADHRHVMLVRQAMQFQKLINNAPDATKKVEKAPLRVERPGSGEVNSLDGRSKAMQRLAKTGRVEDAAAVFASIL